MREPLLPCPFCGAAPTLFGEDNAVFKLARVSCEACGAGGPGHFHNRAEAVQAWSQRAALASPPEEARPSASEGLVERLQRPPRIKGQTPVDITLDAAEFRELMRHRSEAAAAISVGRNIIADLERRLALAASPPDARPSAPEAPDAQEDGDGD